MKIIYFELYFNGETVLINTEMFSIIGYQDDPKIFLFV